MTNASVTSADATMIAYERGGNGDPVIVVNIVAEDRSGQDHAALWMAPEAVVAPARRFFLTDDSDQLGESV